MYENVEFNKSNFCISPIAGQFCSIDYDSDVLRIKNSSGDLQREYSLDTAVSEIKSLEYVGPRDTGLAIAQLGDDLPFLTLESSVDELYYN